MIIETFRQALQNVWSNKLRTFLTMLGIIIGVMAVIVIVGLGNGMTQSMRDSFSALGTNALSIQVWGYGSRTASVEDVYKIADKNKELISAVSPQIDFSNNTPKVGTTTYRYGAVAVGRGAHLGGVVAEIDLGRDCGDELLVLIRDLIHILHRGGAGAVAPDLNGQGIRAQRRKTVPHALGHAVAQTHDDDDRHDTDDDAQHGQKGAELVAPHVLEGLTEGLNDHLFPSCSAGSKFSVGWTMASGARESPS